MFHAVKPMLVSQWRAASVLVVLGLALSACSSDESGPGTPLRTGVFLDSAVEGLGYETATMSGKTNADGEFNFNAGEMITFSIGGLQLPEIQAANVVTPMSVFSSSDAEDVRVVNLSRLLQSMDTDSDVNNGITLPLQVESITSDTAIDFAAADFDAQAQSLLDEVSNSTAMLIGSETAAAHLMQTLVDNNVISSGCTSDHRYVSRSAELSTRAHRVSGTVTVLDDCTIEVTNFNYDGGGPSVYFYAAVDNDFRNPAAIIGPRLNGPQWVNDTLLITLPEGTTLDDFNSLSVWCRDFNANFGDVFIGDS